MGDIGIILVQHGDFPFDFKEKQRPMFDFIEGMLEKISDRTRDLPRKPDDPYSCDMRMLADEVRKAGGFKHFEVGYMEFSSPTIEEAVERLGSQGVKKIILANSPGLMMRSSHSLLDVPAILREISARHPALELIYARPGIPFERIASLFIKRIDSALGKNIALAAIMPIAALGDDFGVVMIAHGDIPLEHLSSGELGMGKAEKHIEEWSDMVRKWPRNEENDPLSYDTLELEKLIREKGGYSNFHVGNLEFASPTLEEALDKALDQGAIKIIFIGGTGFCDRSSHTLVDIPEAVNKLQEAHPEIKMTYAYPDMGLVSADFAAIIVDKIFEALEKGGLPL
ncbi:MAG TPA: CbiX/SirB N-terminal domain-containing protein [Methanocella sp.]|uniref:sirohydrochlorin chelatase n=1 Tax=Methanocella sp. TaxID=2052833 RepID=UPI002CEF3249|nr:CbiX/SirB N-terminal domain-containing protein [Methanocella sp.]HTY91981.1 CbiX/SirB N-terminal domain-containing protein [Methanocella sp.]